MLGKFFRRRPPVAIADPVWRDALTALPCTDWLLDTERQRLRGLCAEFLRDKQFSGAHGFAVTEEVRVAIAVQACLPVLHLGLAPYSDFVGIVVHPDAFIVPRTHVDEAGVITQGDEILSGEAMEGGPVVLAWPDVRPGADNAGWNVVIHEFVHKLDMCDGEPDGVPPLPAARRKRWIDALERSYEAFCAEVDAMEDSMPPDLDPESEQADAWYSELSLDPYAATDPAEFLAVSGELFFMDPLWLRDCFPNWYGCLSDFFGIDLAARAEAVGTDS